MSDLKYLASYLIPIIFFFGIVVGGWMAYGVVIFAFVVVPVLELALKTDASNYSQAEVKSRLSNPFFDVLLYLNVPIVFGAIYFFAIRFPFGSTAELVGLTISLGILMGGNGINVAHELGHRPRRWERSLGQLLLLPSMYMHFYIEHNRGHHKNVGTSDDPATARKGESVFAFWWRSVIGGYRHAWVLESKRLKNRGEKVLSWSNLMVRFTFFQLLYLVVIGLAFGIPTGLALIASALISFLLLECINYVEHYGLTRQRLPGGRYERVRSTHSWNSNHKMGRIILYELTRHSDHHYKAAREYQVLEHHDESPQLPYGYPTSILLSLIPPVWFNIMNSRVGMIENKS